MSQATQNGKQQLQSHFIFPQDERNINPNFLPFHALKCEAPEFFFNQPGTILTRGSTIPCYMRKSRLKNWQVASPLVILGGFSNPIGSTYGIFAHIWLKFMANVGKYTSPMDPSWELFRVQTPSGFDRKSAWSIPLVTTMDGASDCFDAFLASRPRCRLVH